MIENNRKHLSNNTVLVTRDAIGLYNNMPHQDGMSVMKEGLEKRSNNEVPTTHGNDALSEYI